MSDLNYKILAIPWMKQKLESIYDKTLLGNLYLMFNNLNFDDPNSISPNVVQDLLDNYNISVDDNHPLYLYLPIEVNEFIKKLITSFKSLYNDNVYINICGYKEDYPTCNKLDCVADLYMFYPNLLNTIHNSYLIDSSKCYEIFTALSDTQSIYMSPKYSCLLSAPILNSDNKYSNITHISFIRMLEESLYPNACDYYLKGLTNKNNNFNFNY